MSKNLLRNAVGEMDWNRLNFIKSSSHFNHFLSENELKIGDNYQL